MGHFTFDRHLAARGCAASSLREQKELLILLASPRSGKQIKAVPIGYKWKHVTLSDLSQVRAGRSYVARLVIWFWCETHAYTELLNGFFKTHAAVFLDDLFGEENAYSSVASIFAELRRRVVSN